MQIPDTSKTAQSMNRTNRSLPILKVHFKNPSYDFSFQRLQFSVSSMKTKRFSKQNEICFC